MSSQAPRSPSDAVARFILLRPYGDKLLSPLARFWLTLAALLILVMAGVEGFSWGRTAAHIIDGAPGLVIGLAVGGVVFFLIWVIDASLITLDRASGRLEPLVLVEARGARQRSKRSDDLKLAVGIGLRLVIITVSVVITSPFLSGFVFERDISKELEHQTAILLSETRAEVQGFHEDQIGEAAESVEALQQELVGEIAGKGPTGVYGEGPVAAAMRERLVQAEEALAERKQAAEEELEAFDEAAGNVGQLERDTELLGSRWNVVLPSHSLGARRDALAAVLEEDGNREIEWAIRAFLVILVLGVLGIKLFAPRGLDLYFSSLLQSEYGGRYELGLFDPWLPEEERASTGHRMPVERFLEFLTTVGFHARRGMIEAAIGDAKWAERQHRLKALRETRAGVVAERGEQASDLAGVLPALREVRDGVRRLAVKEAHLVRQVGAFEQELEQLDDEADELDLSTVVRLKARAESVKLLQNRQDALTHVRGRLEVERARLEEVEEQAQLIRQRMKANDTEVVDLDQRIRALRGSSEAASSA